MTIPSMPDEGKEVGAVLAGAMTYSPPDDGEEEEEEEEEEKSASH